MDIVVTYHSIYTVLMFVFFIGVWWWAWSSRRAKAFKEAANLPFADDEQERATQAAERAGEEENNHE